MENKKFEWHNEIRKLKDLIPASYNPRKLSEKAYGDLRKSLEKFNLADLPSINTNNTVISGHQRIRVLTDIYGVDHEIEVRVPNRELSVKEEKELNIRSNKNVGEWDWDMMSNEFEVDDLKDWGFDEKDFGFDIYSEDEKDDEVPDAPEEPKSKLGDLYELGEHRVLCGDSTNLEDVEKLMNGKESELLFTSPPYSDMREYNGDKDLSVDNLAKFIPIFYPYCNYQVVNLGIQRKDNNINEYWQEYIINAKDVGYKFLAWNVWEKSSVSLGSQTAFIPIYHEWIFVFGKEFKEINPTQQRKAETADYSSQRQKNGKMSKVKNYGDNDSELVSMKSVFHSNSSTGNAAKSHPATFPLELPNEYVVAMTQNKDIVTDPFLGSGSTLIACEKTGRICYGMELDQKYVDVIVQRYVDYTGNNKIKKNGIEIEW